MNILLTMIGLISVALGFVGIFVPLLPTTPFLILAVACFVRSSPKLHKWLLNHPWFGDYINNYMSGNGITFKAKVTILFTLWTALLLSAIGIDHFHIRIFLGVVGIGVSLHILLIKTCRLTKKSKFSNDFESGDK